MHTARLTGTTLARQRFIVLLGFCLLSPVSLAQLEQEMAGSWVINEDLSDNTDRQVEASLKAAGQKIHRSIFDRRKDRYRGGPPEQELYDHISYDKELTLQLQRPAFTFTYDDGFVRPVYTDNRTRSVSLSGIEEVKDFSFAHFEDGKLLVEGRPRDGGFTQESYALINDGTQLQADLYIQPDSFQEPIEIHRVYDRKPSE